MSDDTYHSETDSLSCSQLKIFCKSPMDYYEQFVTGLMPKKKSTRQMILGTLCHAMLLERKSLDDIVRKYPNRCLNVSGGLISAKAKDFEQEIYPVIAVKEDVYDQAIAICEAVLSTEDLNGIPSVGYILKTGAQFEQRLDAEIDGVECRCKPDIHADIGDLIAIQDLKFCERIYPYDWWRTARQLRYWLQDAHYSRTAESKYGKPASFRFWAAEVNYPFRVRMYEYDRTSKEIAREYHSQKLAEFKRCKDSGNWEDVWDTVGVVSPWDVGANSDGELLDWEE